MQRIAFFFCLMAVSFFIMPASSICAEKPKSGKTTAARNSTGARQTDIPRKRVALVIGNSHYIPTPLNSPANEAHVMAAALRRFGFEVEEKYNLGQGTLKQALNSFNVRRKHADVGLLYYAGHAIQVKGKNYLLPIDLKVSNERQVREKAVTVDMVVNGGKKTSGSSIIILEASRDLPPESSFKPEKSGLAEMVPPAGSFIAFAAAPGKTAVQGTDRVGIYTNTLIKIMETPGLRIEELFHQLRNRVADSTGQSQVPWEASSLSATVYFVPPFDPTGSQSIVNGITGDKKAKQTSPLSGFTDSFTGMEFVPVPGGCYQRGNVFGGGFPWETPVHTACVSDFSIGRFEVTQGQWKGVMENNPSQFSTCGDDCPVEQVSWEDAQEFIRRLNQKTGGAYRLPTEAEWEYAARSGGRNELYSGGDDADAVAWHSGNSEGSTRRIGTKKANGLGIHDMSGNVWEWVQDWFENYDDRPQINPTGPSTGSSRIFRGGCWSHPNVNSRTVIRYYNTPGSRFNFLGLRLAAPAVR